MIIKILEILNKYKLDFLKGLIVTLLIAILATIIGLIIGLLLVKIKVKPINKEDKKIMMLYKRLSKAFTSFYILFFRGTPMLVQTFLIYFGFSALGFSWDYLTLGYYISTDFWLFNTGTLPAAIIIVSINTGAYMAEILRSGINAIDIGQNEAARSLGLNYKQTYRYIILPQALKNSIPSLGNMFITNIKDTSILNAIGVAELFFVAKVTYTNLYTPVESFILVSAIYLCLTMVSTIICNLYEKKSLTNKFTTTNNKIENIINLPASFYINKETPNLEYILEINNLTKYYNKQIYIDCLTLKIKPQEIICLTGPSGSGKSTTLRCINLLEDFEKGTIFYKGANLRKNKDFVGKEIGMVFQSFNLFPHLSILENCCLAQELVLKRTKEEALTISQYFLNKVGLLDQGNKYPCQLSGGQKQRVSIARVLVMNPDVILFDEPTSALDYDLVEEVIDIMQELAKEKMTMLIVTHDLRIVNKIATRNIILKNGIIVEDNKTNNSLIV